MLRWYIIPFEELIRASVGLLAPCIDSYSHDNVRSLRRWRIVRHIKLAIPQTRAFPSERHIHHRRYERSGAYELVFGVSVPHRNATRYVFISFLVIVLLLSPSTLTGDDLPRLVHHLGPRYSGTFQDPNLIKFLTYDASTSLNMFLTNATKNSDVSPLMKAVKNGLGVPESLFVFSLSASDCTASGQNTAVPVKGLLKEVESQGNVFTVKATTLDMALWKIGGAAVALRLVQLAQVLSFLSMVVLLLIDGVNVDTA